MTQKLALSSKPYVWMILTGVAVVFGLVALGLALAWIQVVVPAGQSKDLEARLAKVETYLALQHASLTTDFAKAADMPDALKQVSAEIQAVRGEAARIGSAKLLLPGVRPLVDSIIAHADALQRYCDILLGSADYTLKRAKAFTEIANALDQLSGLSKTGVTVLQGEKIVKDARADFSAAYAEMDSAEPTTPVLYSNVYVMPHLDAISTSLAGIEEAIVARNAPRIGKALQVYMGAVKTDWAASMKLQDPAGRQAANTAARSAEHLSESPGKRAKALSSFAQTLFLWAIFAAVIAAASAYGARTLRAAEDW